MKNFVFAVISIFLLASCESKAPIPAEKFQNVLIDLYTADISAQLNDSTKLQEKEKDFEKLSLNYSSVLNHYEISQKEFIDAFKWYQYHPDVLDSIYENAIAEIAIIRQSQNAANVKK